MDDKHKQIENLQKKLKMPVTDHPQTDEIMAYQKNNDDLKEEVLDLKSKLLQADQEKEELMNKVEDQIVPIASQEVDTKDLTISLSQVSLIEKDISTLKE